MGWVFSRKWKTIEDVLKSLHDDRLDPSIVCLTEAVVTEEDSLHVRWQAILHQGHSYVRCDLLDKSDGWGYKDMSDDMGPMFFSCPLSVLDAADKYPAKTETAIQWRANCRGMHASSSSQIGIDNAIKQGRIAQAHIEAMSGRKHASRSGAHVETVLEFATKKNVVKNETAQLETSNL